MSTLIFFQENKASAPFLLDDRIFLGEGLFETLRVVDGKPCYPEQHWQRLSRAALFLGIPFNLALELWIEKLNQFIRFKKLSDGGIKALLSGGSAPRGLIERGNESHLVLDAFQYIPNAQPLTLVSAPWQRDAKNPIYQLKSINYLEAIIAHRQAKAAGADDALFFNFQNQAADTTVANLFIIKNNCLLTPALHCGVLPGIIRQRLLTLCKEQGIDGFEVEIDKNSLIEADAAFTSNALQGIRPIGSYEGCIFNTEHLLIELLQELLTSGGSTLKA